MISILRSSGRRGCGGRGWERGGDGGQGEGDEGVVRGREGGGWWVVGGVGGKQPRQQVLVKDLDVFLLQPAPNDRKILGNTH